MCVTHSAVRCRKRIPRPHHSRRSFCVASTVLTLVFILAWPFTQSTIVLQSPLISRVGHCPASEIPSSKGRRGGRGGRRRGGKSLVSLSACSRWVKIYSKDVPWRVNCGRMVEHVYSVTLIWERKLVLESRNSWTESRDGKQRQSNSCCGLWCLAKSRRARIPSTREQVGRMGRQTGKRLRKRRRATWLRLGY